MAKDSALLDYLMDQLESLGGIASRAMFGGHSLFIHGLMIAIIDEETLYLKVDGINRPAFEKEGMRPFTYASRGKRIALGYWEAPPAVIEEPDELRRWVLDAASAARRSHNARTSRKPTRKKPAPARKPRRSTSR
jgi:DNA transformation protein and related proteins